jgi:hypothetical protein
MRCGRFIDRQDVEIRVRRTSVFATTRPPLGGCSQPNESGVFGALQPGEEALASVGEQSSTRAGAW